MLGGHWRRHRAQFHEAWQTEYHRAPGIPTICATHMWVLSYQCTHSSIFLQVFNTQCVRISKLSASKPSALLPLSRCLDPYPRRPQIMEFRKKHQRYLFSPRLNCLYYLATIPVGQLIESNRESDGKKLIIEKKLHGCYYSVKLFHVHLFEFFIYFLFW